MLNNDSMTRRSLLSILPWVLVSATRVGAQRAATVYKDPTCGCCTKWLELLRTNGFAVTVRNIAELDRSRYPVPAALRSCHTAIVGGHIVARSHGGADTRENMRAHLERCIEWMKTR